MNFWVETRVGIVKAFFHFHQCSKSTIVTVNECITLHTQLKMFFFLPLSLFLFEVYVGMLFCWDGGWYSMVYDAFISFTFEMVAVLLK